MEIVVHPFLPIVPTLEEDVVRMVRHGLADILECLGEEVGPKPGDAVHVIHMGTHVFVSQEVRDRLQADLAR